MSDKTIKRPYVKPGLERVELVMEESVLGDCKVSSGPGPTALCQTLGGQACRGNAKS